LFVKRRLPGRVMESKKSFYIETYGCEMNKSDSVDIALSLEEKGYARAASADGADVVVLNTCSVREHAEERIIGRLGLYRSLKAKRNRDMVIVFAGCMAQEQGEKIRELFPEIDIVSGTYHYLGIPDAVQQYQRTGLPLVFIDQAHYDFSHYKGRRAEGYRAWVNIIMGCSNFCSYCIVPYVRGPEKSKKSSEIIDEIKGLAGRGVVEVTLLGQNVNAYGKDSGDITFIDLLESVNKIEGIRWIRFLTSHPKDFNEKIIERISDLEKVCKHFHLPIQSGSDKILSLMNRKYDTRHYRSVIDAVRKYMPNSSITTDIVVGFPEEGETDFEMTLAVVRDIGYDDAFTYLYSERPFTRALSIPVRIDSERASMRLEKLITLQRSISFKKNQAEIGKEVMVLVEKSSKKNAKELLCRTEKNKMVVVETDAQVGSFIDVRLKSISGSTLRGTIVKQSN